MDDLDRRLLELLRENARRSFVEIAKDLGVSEGTVRSRVQRLQETGVIRRFTVETAGGAVQALVDVDVDTHVATSDVSKRIADLAGVRHTWETAGSVDIVAFIDAPTTDALNDVVETIRHLDGVRGTRSHLVLKKF